MDLSINNISLIQVYLHKHFFTICLLLQLLVGHSKWKKNSLDEFYFKIQILWVCIDKRLMQKANITFWKKKRFSSLDGHLTVACRWTSQGFSCLQFKFHFLESKPYLETPRSVNPTFIIWCLLKWQKKNIYYDIKHFNYFSIKKTF